MTRSVTAAEVANCGVSCADSAPLAEKVNRAFAEDALTAWRQISRDMLLPDHPFELHNLLFQRAFSDWDHSRHPPAAWFPTDEEIRATNVGRMMAECGFNSVAELQDWSARERSEFWAHMIDRLDIRLKVPYECVLDLAEGVERPRWLLGARLNIVDSCFGAPPDKTAIVYQDESGARETISYGELERLVNRVAAGLRAAGFRPGDAIAIYLPMTIESVAAYLGIIRAGCVAVSVADSLAAEEVAVRLRLSAAKAVVTQAEMVRGGKSIRLYDKVVEAGAKQAIVVDPTDATKLRPADIAWQSLLSHGETFEPHVADSDEPTNILFSSGTTGEPKAIPWSHLTPIKCAVDAYLHQDVQPADRVAWPTNLGWMMGPWLIYASLINRATMALYGGAPTGRDFGKFVADAQVTMLGVIPSLVKTWRATQCMGGLDWSHVRRFSSTGECASADDMLYLMSLAGYKPVIEYCGGTELGGGYIGATMAQPNVPAMFSTPSFGVELVTGVEGDDGETGEVFLVPPAIGMSTRLLHHDHHVVYYEGTPRGPRGETLRRHGDTMERLPGGYWRAGGRVDDTMNLGGIKVSSVEIERTLVGVPGVQETAAVAFPPAGGGPCQLWVFVVPSGETAVSTDDLREQFQTAIRRHLNPLFKIHAVQLVDALPRTASHKIMRRVLRKLVERA